MRKAFLDREWYLKYSTVWLIVLTVVLFLVWLPVKLTLYPAAVLGDSNVMLNQATGIIPLSNGHSVAYVLLLRVSLFLGHVAHLNINMILFLFAEIQSLVMAFVLAWFLLRLLRRAPLWLVGVALLFFMLEPVIPVYSITIHSDVAFMLAFLIFTVLLWELVHAEKPPNLKRLFALGCVGVLLSLFRNQGIFSVILSLIVAAILVRAVRRNLLVVAAACAAIMFSLLLVVFPALHMSASVDASFGIPIQQVARVIAEGEQLTPQDQQVVNSIMPLQDWKKYYTPGLVDPLKWSPTFDTSYFTHHVKSFLSVWFRELLRHPRIYARAWALQTEGFWNPLKSPPGQYAETHIVSNQYGIVRTNILQKVTGINMASALDTRRMPSWFVPPGVLTWLVVLVSLAVVVRKRTRLIVPLAPALSTLLIMFLATPIAYCLRYVMCLVLLLPLLAYLPFDTIDQGKKKRTEKTEVSSERLA